MLHLFKRTSERRVRGVDAICSGLQLATSGRTWRSTGRRTGASTCRRTRSRASASPSASAERRCDRGWPRTDAVPDRTHARDACRARGRSGERCRAASARDPRHRRGRLRILEKIDRAGYDVFRRRPVRPLDWPLLLCALNRAHDDRGMTPDEYCQQKAAAAARASTTAFLFLPARAARDHRALRVLPRGGRRRRRDAATRRSPRRSSPGGAARSPTCSRAQPQHPVDQGARAGRKPFAHHAAPAERDHRRHGDGPRPDRYLDFAGPRALLLPRRRASWACSPPASSATATRARSSTPRPRHRLPAHQHHPRRRRGRAQEPHLPADGRAHALRVPAADILQRTASDAFRQLMAFQAERAARYYDKALAALPARGPQAAAPRAHHGRDLPHAARRDRARRLPRPDATSLTPLRKLWIAWKTWIARSGSSARATRAWRPR